MSISYKSVVSPILVGREATLALFDSLLDGLPAGSGQTVLVAGETGIGKSRLVAEVARRAAAGMAVLQGRCFEADRALPYGPLIDLLHAFLAGRRPAEMAAALGPAAPQLARLLPELDVPPGTPGAPPDTPTPLFSPEQDKRRLQQAVGQFLAAQSAKRPLLVVIEDLHWSDDSSLEAILSLVRDVPARPMLLLLTYRAEDIDPALAHFLAEIDRARLAVEVTLDPLTPAQVEAMVRAIFELRNPVRPEFLDALYSLTEGNPFFIEEVLKSLLAAGDIFYANGAWDRKEMSELHIPRSIHDAVRQQVDRLEPDTRRLLALAAVLGRRFDFSLLQHLAGRPEDELMHLIRELIDANLIVEESADRLAFRHELTRQAIYTGLMARERLRTHRAIADTLERTQIAPPEGLLPALAHHFYEAGDCEKAMDYALQVADQAVEVYAHAEALYFLDRARQCAERLGWTDRVAILYERMGDVYFISGPMDQAVDSYRRALELAATDPIRAVLQSKIGRSYVTVSNPRGLAPLHTALDVLDPETQQHELALALATLGRYYHLHAEHDRAIEFLERAWNLAEPLDDTQALGDIYVFLAGSYQHLLRFEESMAWALAGIALGERKNYPMAMATGYEYLAENAVNLGKWREALEYAASDREIGTRIGSHSRVGWAEWGRSMALQNLGELPASIEAATTGYREAEEAGDRRLMLWTLGTLSLAHALMGAEEAAESDARRAMALAGELGLVVMHCWGAIALAAVHRLRDEPGPAAAVLDDCAARLAGTRNRLAPLFIGPVHAEAYYDQGKLDDAARLIADFLALATDAESVHRQAVAWRIQGQIWAAQQRWDDALPALDRAAAALDALGSRVELACALYHRAAALLARRDGPDLPPARDDLARALALCRDIGLRPLELRVRAALARLHQAARDDLAAERELAAARAVVDELAAGYADPDRRAAFLARAGALLPPSRPVTPRRRAKQQFGGLTERERQVAALVAQGKSNRDIAAALVVSERTVTTHVSNILNKLNFSSRSQIAAWMTGRLDPPDPD